MQAYDKSLNLKPVANAADGPVFRDAEVRRVAFNFSLSRAIAIMVMMVGGLFLRVANLEDFPRGMHGDEAWTAIRAQDIANGVSVGIYDPVHSIGQVSGSEYAAVPFVKSVIHPVRAARLPSALVGTLTLIAFAAWALLTNSFSGAFAGVVIFSLWAPHIMQSRQAFPGIYYAFFEVLALCGWALWSKKESRFGIVAAAFFSAAGNYFYNGFAGFTIFSFMLFFASKPGTFWKALRLYVPVFLVVIAPFVYTFLFEQGMSGRLGAHAHGIAASTNPVAEFASNYLDIFGMMLTVNVDMTDSIGIVSTLGYLVVFLALVGAYNVWSRRDKLGIVMFVLVFAIPVFSAPLNSFTSAIFRRSFGIYPIILWFSARGLQSLYQHISNRKYAKFVYAGVLAALSFSMASDIHTYYRSRQVDVIFPVYFGEIYDVIRTSTPKPKILRLIAPAVGADYESFRYLFPDMVRRDGSSEFGERFLAGKAPPGRHLEPGEIVIVVDKYYEQRNVLFPDIAEKDWYISKSSLPHFAAYLAK